MSLLNPTEADIIGWAKMIAHPVSVEAGLMATSLITTAFRQLELANAILAKELVALREFKAGVEADAAEAIRVPTSGLTLAKRAFDGAVGAGLEAEYGP